VSKSRTVQKTIRNTRGVTIRMNLKGKINEPEFRVNLSPRGKRGDWVTVPGPCTLDGQFENFLALGLIEVIPLTEARKIQYSLPTRPVVNIDGQEIRRAPVSHMKDTSRVRGTVDVTTDDRGNHKVNIQRAAKTPSLEEAEGRQDAAAKKLQEKGVMPKLPTRAKR
jgi:hypothetical protein